jgi:hypothetical protein
MFKTGATEISLLPFLILKQIELIDTYCARF